jgi:hypothetical protein
VNTTPIPFHKPTNTAYIPSAPGSPKVYRQAELPPLKIETTLQDSPAIRGLRKKWDNDERRRTASKRRLSTYTADERRVLEVRCYHGRKIHHKGDLELSALLDVAPQDLDSLWHHPHSVSPP